MTVATQSVLTEILDYMDEHFSGDLTVTAGAAAEYARNHGLAQGPLWDEIGVQVLKQVYRVQRIATSKACVRKASKMDGIAGSNTDARAMWYNISGRYYNLFDLTKPEVEEVAEYYSTQAASYEFEQQFLEKVARSLKKGQKVRDVFDMDGLRELRKKLVA